MKKQLMGQLTKRKDTSVCLPDDKCNSLETSYNHGEPTNPELKNPMIGCVKQRCPKGDRRYCAFNCENSEKRNELTLERKDGEIKHKVNNISSPQTYMLSVGALTVTLTEELTKNKK